MLIPGTARRWTSGGTHGTKGRAAAGTIALAMLVAACGSSGQAHSSSVPPTTRPPSAAGGSHVPTTTTVPPTTTTSTSTSTSTTADPGSLPQTSDQPSTGSPLNAQMETLWAAMISGSESQALPVFFPESAYITTKVGQLPNPAGDYSDRLLAFYLLDIAVYHQLLASGPGTATLISVDSDAGDAAWIGPGQCENAVGYWHLPGVRLVYELGGTERSFAVASLISWRGVWYVIHLGPNPRPTNVGTVDQPASGPGTPGPAGGC